jgi:hypothetical protein
VSSKDKNGVTRYTKVGAIFEGDKGLSVAIDRGVSISCGDGVYVNGYVPKPREGGAQGGGAEFPADDSDIPF